MNELEFNRLVHEIDKLQTQLDATRNALRFAAVEVEFDEEGMPAVTRTAEMRDVDQLRRLVHWFWKNRFRGYYWHLDPDESMPEGDRIPDDLRAIFNAATERTDDDNDE